MPELPEAETIKRSLLDKVIGKEIVSVDIKNKTVLKKQDENIFLSRINHLKIYNVHRRGKGVIIEGEQEGNKYYILVQLGMSGALLYIKDLDTVPFKEFKHFHIITTLNDGNYLVFKDIRKFGRFALFTENELSNLPFIKNMGAEPFWDNAEELFIKSIRRKKYENKSIKDTLLQQDVIAGIGNIYASEILYESNINPFKTVKELSDKQLSLILDNTIYILNLSISLGGSSISDYIDVDGKRGSYQEHFLAYEQTECKKCNGEIIKTPINNRATYYCPTCQK